MTMRKDTYPTWRRINARLIVSAEERDGTPDFYIAREDRGPYWRVKWRTSAHWEGFYESPAEAKQAIAESLAYGAKFSH